MELFLKDDIDVQFVFCGKGPLEATIRDKFTDFLDKKVFLLGWQEQSIIPNLLYHCHAAWILMSGFVLLEAATVGAPIITSNREWHAEFIKDGINGYVVDPENLQEIFGKTLHLISTKDLRDQFKINARKNLEKFYNPEMLLEKEKNIYYNLMKINRDKWNLQ